MTDVKKEFNEWREADSKNTLAFAARATGYSRPVISDWANNKYTGNDKNVDVKIKAFLTLQKNKAMAHSNEVRFTDTVVSMKVWDALDYCSIENQIVVITGEPGLGKTTALEQYMLTNVNDIFLEVDQSFSAFSMVKDLHRRLKPHTGKESFNDMVKDVIQALLKSGRKIIIDEAEYLPTKALDTMRRISDKAKIGIALVGLPRLEANLRGKRGEYAQLSGRVEVWVKLEKISEDDANDIIQIIAPNTDIKIVKMLYNKAPNTRSLVKLTKRSVRIAALNNVDINAQVIDAASNNLML